MVGPSYFDTALVSVKLTVKISSIFVVFLENMNFNGLAAELVKLYIKLGQTTFHKEMK